jgi:hypothetical protein
MTGSRDEVEWSGRTGFYWKGAWFESQLRQRYFEAFRGFFLLLQEWRNITIKWSKMPSIFFSNHYLLSSNPSTLCGLSYYQRRWNNCCFFQYNHYYCNYWLNVWHRSSNVLFERPEGVWGWFPKPSVQVSHLYFGILWHHARPYISSIAEELNRFRHKGLEWHQGVIIYVQIRLVKNIYHLFISSQSCVSSSNCLTKEGIDVSLFPVKMVHPPGFEPSNC